MKKTFQNTCFHCGEIHEGSPNFSFHFPAQYDPDATHTSQKLSDDFCTTGEGYFIRTILEIPIIDMQEPFVWGVWVSQNQTDFQFYFDHFNETLEGRETVGQICNILPYYKNTTGLDCTVLFQDAKNRPNVLMAKSDHELAKDFHNGISLQKAQKIASIAIHEYQDTFA